MASTVRVNTIEPYTGTDVTIDGDIILNGDKTINGNLTVTGQVSVPRLLSGTNITAWGTDASGTNAAATDVTQVAPLSTGNATPAALVWQVGVQGASGATPQVATEAFRVQEVANASSREVVAMNVTGPLWGGIPANISAALLENGDSLRVATRLLGLRIGSAFSAKIGRANGSFSSPTAVLVNESVGNFSFRGYDGTLFAEGASVGGVARENFSNTTRGMAVRVVATDIGSSAGKSIFDFRGGGVGIAEWVSLQTTLRLIPGATQIAFRDSGNTADTWSINAAGTSISAPLLTSLTQGVQASGTNTAASDLTITGPLSTGNATPAALLWRVGVQGASGSTAQTATEGWRVQEIANSTAREVAGLNTSGPLMGNWPTNVNTIFTSNGDGGRFQTRLRVARAGGSPTFLGTRSAGSLASPTQATSGSDMFTLGAAAYTSGATEVLTATITARLRENATTTGFGSQWLVSATDTGTATLKDLLSMRGGGTNIAEILALQSTLRLISGATQIAFRDSGNTADTFTVNAAGTAITAPLATSFQVASLLHATTPAAGQTALWVYDADNATLERVTVGAADSGGVGFKVLRIPN